MNLICCILVIAYVSNVLGCCGKIQKMIEKYEKEQAQMIKDKLSKNRMKFNRTKDKSSHRHHGIKNTTTSNQTMGSSVQRSTSTTETDESQPTSETITTSPTTTASRTTATTTQMWTLPPCGKEGAPAINEKVENCIESPECKTYFRWEDEKTKNISGCYEGCVNPEHPSSKKRFCSKKTDYRGVHIKGNAVYCNCWSNGTTSLRTSASKSTKITTRVTSDETTSLSTLASTKNEKDICEEPPDHLETTGDCTPSQLCLPGFKYKDDKTGKVSDCLYGCANPNNDPDGKWCSTNNDEVGVHTGHFEYCNCGNCTGDDSCCSSDNRCGEGEGDCDKDEDCDTGLTCGDDNCIGPTFEDDDDCCFKKN